MKAGLKLVAFMALTIGQVAASELDPKGEKVKLDDLAGYSIVVPKDAALTTRFAAEKLRDGLKAMTGVELKIDEGEKSKPHCFAFNSKELANDQGYRITVKNGDVGITGGKRGPWYAVAALLEEDWGVRWYGIDQKAPVYPKTAAKALAVTPREYDPPFLAREVLQHAVIHGSQDFRMFNRIQPVAYFTTVDPKYGGPVANNMFCHTYSTVCPGTKYFKDHPEYFPLVNGKRYDGGGEKGQLCCTAPGLDDLFVEAFEKESARRPGSVIFSVTANDNLFATCQCEECRKILKAENLCALEMHLANRVARKVKAKHPDWILNTWAYSNTAEPPPTMAPDDNVAMFYAPIGDRGGAKIYSPWRQIDSIARQYGTWTKRAKKLMIWDYAMIAHGPNPNLEAMADNIRLWRDTGALAVMLEDSEWSLNSLAPLKCWVFQHLFWNPDLDWKALADEFVDGYYGPAAKLMHEYMAIQLGLVERLKKAGKLGKEDIYVTDADYLAMKHLLMQAFAAAGDDKALGKRIANEYCALLASRLKGCNPDTVDDFEADYLRLRYTASKFDVPLFYMNPLVGAEEKNKPFYAKCEKRIAAARGGGGAFERYSRGSICIGDCTVWVGVESVKDDTAVTKKAKVIGPKMDWGLQYDLEELIGGQVNQSDYVLRVRVRPRLKEKHSPEDPILYFGMVWAGRQGPYPGAAIKVKDLPKDGEWGWAYFMVVNMYTAGGGGTLYSCSQQLKGGDFIDCDYAEFIPAKDFKDKSLIDRLPKVVF